MFLHVEREKVPVTEHREEVRGVHLWALNWLLIGLASIVAVALTITVNRTNREYDAMQASAEEFARLRQDAANLENTSDYLTEQVRTFLVTFDRSALDAYFTELQVTRRREQSLERIRQEASSADQIDCLERAMRGSERLMLRELYAMRLVIAGSGRDVAEYPAELQAVELSEADAALIPRLQIDQGRRMVFNEEYRTVKQEVSDNVSRCVDLLLKEDQGIQEDNSRRLDRLLRLQTALILTLLGIGFIIVLATLLLAIRPLRRAVDLIRSEEKLPRKGAYEMRFLARVYNRMFEQNSQKRRELSYEVNHDSLTGLLNRSAYDRERESLSWEDRALFLIDVDHFKTINDSYGHDIGDRVLKRVGEVLTAHFRSGDSIFRIGGDEFSVIINGARPELREMITQKVAEINRELGDPGDGLPRLSISVGVAFGREGSRAEEIFKEADQALYRVKNRGRGGCDFNT